MFLNRPPFHIRQAHDYSLDIALDLIKFLEAQPECIPVGDQADILSAALVHVLASARPSRSEVGTLPPVILVVVVALLL